MRKINEELWMNRIVPDSARRRRSNLFTLKYTEEAIANLVKKGCFRRGRPERIFDEDGRSERTTRSWSGVDAEGPISMAMGILRLEMGKELKLIDEKDFQVPLDRRLPSVRMGRRARSVSTASIIPSPPPFPKTRTCSTPSPPRSARRPTTSS